MPEPDLHARTEEELREIVAEQARELERQRAAIASLEESVRVMGDFVGMLKAERERSFSLTRPMLGLEPQHPPRPLQVPRYYLWTRPPRDAPTISIVTPSFNQGQFIERTVRSVLAQRYPKLEYVVRDGGSSDGTVAVLERYAPLLTAAVSEPDGGQGDAINRGFEGSTGEIMAYLNSDDLLLPGTLAYVARYFARHPEVDAVYGHRVLIDADDRETGIWVVPPHQDWVTKIQDFIPQETLFWRRRAWEKVGAYFDTSLYYAVDWDLLLRFVAAGLRIVRLPRFHGAFRVHDEQKTIAAVQVAVEEADRLRERANGERLTPGEIVERLRPYFIRQRLLHEAYVQSERLPIPRVDALAAGADGLPPLGG